MFGYVKKEVVTGIIKREMELDYLLYQKYMNMVKALKGREGESEESIMLERYTETADVHFTRYMTGKELLAQIEGL